MTTRELLVAPDVWSAGDAASRRCTRAAVSPVTANALWAIKAGDQVGRNVARALRGRPGRRFRYLGLGQAASFGVGRGVADLYGFPLTGWVAWVMRVGFFVRFMPTRSRAVRFRGAAPPRPGGSAPGAARRHAVTRTAVPRERQFDVPFSRETHVLAPDRTTTDGRDRTPTVRRRPPGPLGRPGRTEGGASCG